MGGERPKPKRQRHTNPNTVPSTGGAQPKEVSMGISTELKRVLDYVGVEAEIDAAFDAALEEGLPITREQVVDILREDEGKKDPHK